jgi:hypothetical protein
MDHHERLAIEIALSDLRYVAGSVLQAGGGPKSWPFVQWATAVGFEAQKHLGDVHDVRFELDWEDEFAAAARHGSKFFDGGPTQLDSVVKDFSSLAAATHLSFFPPDRRGGRIFDFLRDDLAVIADGDEVLMTNVTGHFMVGLPPERAAQRDVISHHVRRLTTGLGQLASVFTGARVDEIRQHGNADHRVQLTCWDGKMERALPATFGGELDRALAFAVISILSSVQGARRWGRAACCGLCAAAALKHRFVVAHHAAKSIAALSQISDELGPLATERLTILAWADDALVLTSPPYRRLRNGWLHLGLGDVAAEISDSGDLLAAVRAYTATDPATLAATVDRYLDELATGLNGWLLTSAHNGRGLYSHLHRPPPD